MPNIRWHFSGCTLIFRLKQRVVSLTEELSRLVRQVFGEVSVLGHIEGVTRSQRPDLCDFQCNDALRLARTVGLNPRELAEQVCDPLREYAALDEASVAGPGFINLKVSDAFLSNHLNKMVVSSALACSKPDEINRIFLDFGGPNIAKPMHVGHLRSSIIGESLQRICRFLGYEVISDAHLGDWGTQMGMVITELERRQPNLAYFSENSGNAFPKNPPFTVHELDEIYPAASKRCGADEGAMVAARRATVELQNGHPGYRALWRHVVDTSLQGLKRDFKKLGISFDFWLGESDSQADLRTVLDQLKQAGQLTESEGALVVPIENATEANTPPLIMVKSDGGLMYGSTDLVTIYQRVNRFRPDLLWYVVDARQNLHFQQVFGAARQSGIAGDSELEHIGFGTVNGKDGKPFKTRAGGVMKLADLMHMATEAASRRLRESGIAQEYDEAEKQQIAELVGLGAVKFADLVNHRLTSYIFDLDKFLKFDGKTGPYIQYAAVRIKSILRKASDKNYEAGDIHVFGKEDRDLALTLARFPDIVENAYLQKAPNVICEYLHELSQTFSRFYRVCHILSEVRQKKRAAWLGLSVLTLKQLETGLDLLGIGVPARM